MMILIKMYTAVNTICMTGDSTTGSTTSSTEDSIEDMTDFFMTR